MNIIDNLYAFIRVSNEIKTIRQCLNSIDGIFKHGIIVCNNSNDGTYEECAKFVKHNKCFILTEYNFSIKPCNFNENDIYEKTLADFYNYTFSFIPIGAYFIKIDCDHIYLKDKLIKSFDLFVDDTNILSYPKLNCHILNNELYVYKQQSIINAYDHWLLKKTKDNYFFNQQINNNLYWEQIKLNNNLIRKNTEIVNVHFPYMKKHRFNNNVNNFILYDDFIKQYNGNIKIDKDLLTSKYILNLYNIKTQA